MLLVIKVGGDLLANGLPENLVDELISLNQTCRIVLVHGGGDIVTELSTKLGHPPKFLVSPRGFRSRYTDRETAEIFTMVMAGRVNKEVIRQLQTKGMMAVGLSGLDGQLIKATRKKQLIVLDERNRRRVVDGDYTGQIRSINTQLLNLLLDSKYVPVVSPVAIGEECEPLNVDADRTASNTASSMKADRLVLLTDVQNVVLDGKPVDRLHVSEAKEIIEKLGAGMITKVFAAVEAVEAGVPEAIIASGLIEQPLSKAINHETGTVIYK